MVAVARRGQQLHHCWVRRRMIPTVCLRAAASYYRRGWGRRPPRRRWLKAARSNLFPRFMLKSVVKSNKIEHETPPELPRAMPRDAPRLYLITPPISDWTPYPLLFEASMATCDVAFVLFRTAAREGGEKEKIVRVLVPLVQKHGVACLLADDPQWALRAKADGVHIDGSGERL